MIKGCVSCWGVFLFIAILSISVRASAEEATVIAIPEWQPDMNIPAVDEWGEKYFTSDSLGAMPQQGMNRYLAVLADLWDSRLMLAYIQSSARRNGEEKRALANEQEQWLKKREAESLEAEKSEEGGSLALRPIH